MALDGLRVIRTLGERQVVIGSNRQCEAPWNMNVLQTYYLPIGRMEFISFMKPIRKG